MLDETGVIVHAYFTEQAEPSEVTNTARLNKELKMLKRGLPVEPAAACFVCVDERRMDLMKVLISGAADTPYAHGLYQFDVMFPGNYPLSPPSFKLMTTGGGLAYFGPNLYSCGYVCLSIINTWSGSAEEMWQPERSSILQVLLSIQTLVMDNNILEKEPGYSGYPEDHIGNVAYCNIVKYLNMKFAVLETLRSPPKEFKEVVVQHFALKKQEVLATLDRWTAAAESDTHEYGSDEGSSYNQWCTQLFSSVTPKVAWEELKAEIVREFDRF
jgi:ubiquitin-protein ligase